MGVYRFTGSISPGATLDTSWWVAYPNNNPDLSLTWELRPVWQAGHNGHPGHKVNLVPVEVERTNDNPRGFWSRFLIVSTGTHPTDWELLANYQQI
jgi:hypothetical protein